MTNMFSDKANENNLKKGSCSCTGSEFLTITPVLHRWFSNVVRPREQEFAPYVESMVAALNVIMLLQACRTGQVSADELRTAIFTHLVLCMAAHGPDFFRPKHHYAMHLPEMLARFGYLLSTFVQERKHRLVTRYARDRRTLQSFETGVIEDITCHQLWELQRPLYFATKSAKPTQRMMHILKDIFPGAELLIVNNVSVNGGKANHGDVVAFFENDEMQVGQLLVTVGVVDTSATVSFVAKWQQDKLDASWLTCVVSDDDVCQIPTNTLDTVFTYRMASDRKSCAVHLPPELRPRA